MEREARALTAALRDPHEPSICATCLLWFFDYFDPSVLKENLRLLRTSQHEFLRAAMVFITASRTDASREETRRYVTAALSTCPSRASVSEEHDRRTRALPEGANLLHWVIAMLFQLVDLCLCDSDRRVVQSQRFSSRGLWPCSIEDLLPFGPEQSFISLLQWLAVRDRGAIITAGLEHILLTCRDALGPVIMKNLTRRHIFNTIAYQMQDAASWLKDEREKSHPPGQESCDPQLRICTLNEFLYTMLRTFTERLTDSPLPLVQGHELALVKGIEEALPLIEDREKRSRLIIVGTILHFSARTLPADRPRDLQNPFLAVQDESNRAASIVQRVVYGLSQQRNCCADDCTVSERELARRLQRCAGCGVVQYCSKDCQRRHWKAPETPHKAICSLLKRLAPILKLEQSEFRDRVRGMSVGYDELALIYAYILPGDIPSFSRGPLSQITIAEKVHQMTIFLRMQDEMLGDSASLNRDALRNGMAQLGVDANFLMPS